MARKTGARCEVALCLTGGGKGKGTDVGRDHTSLGAKIWLTRIQFTCLCACHECDASRATNRPAPFGEHSLCARHFKGTPPLLGKFLKHLCVHSPAGSFLIRFITPPERLCQTVVLRFYITDSGP